MFPSLTLPSVHPRRGEAEVRRALCTLRELEAPSRNLPGSGNTGRDLQLPKRFGVLQTAPGHCRASGGAAERGGHSPVPTASPCIAETLGGHSPIPALGGHSPVPMYCKAPRWAQPCPHILQASSPCASFHICSPVSVGSNAALSRVLPILPLFQLPPGAQHLQHSLIPRSALHFQTD